jgi:hypothetical protein
MGGAAGAARRSAGIVLAAVPLLAAVLAVAPAWGLDPYDKVLDEDHFQEIIQAEQVCLVVYHVGKDAQDKPSLARLVSLVYGAAGRTFPFFRADVGSFTPGARNLVTQDIGRAEFPALVLYHAGSPMERAFPPPDSLRLREQDAWYDDTVERLRPLFAPPPSRRYLFTEPQEDGPAFEDNPAFIPGDQPEQAAPATSAPAGSSP